jgi:kinesin family protein 4/21/27
VALRRQLAAESGRAQDAEDRARLLGAQAAESKRALAAETRKHAEVAERLEQATSHHREETQQLRDDLAIAVAELQRQETADEPGESAELQEALDALSTLEKALLESQDERERLMGQIEDLRRQSRTMPASNELDELRAALASAHAELSKQRAGDANGRGGLTRSSANGLGLNGYFDSAAMLRGESTDSSDLEYVDARRSPWPASSPLPTPSQPLPAIPQRLANSSTSSASTPAKLPPPTPPPTIPPPPLPTSTSDTQMVPLGRPGGNRTSAASSSGTRNSQQHDAALPSSTVRNSTASTTSELTVDSRVQRKLEEQEQMVRRVAP